MRSSRLVGTVVSVMVLAAGISACQDPDNPSPENTPALARPPRQQAHRAPAATLRKMSRTRVLKALAAGPTTKRFAHIDLEIRSRAATVTGRGDMAFSRNNPSFEMEMAGSCLCAGNVDMVIANRKMYFHIPGRMPEGAYILVDPNRPNGFFTRGFSRLSDELDPLSALLAMRPGFRKVHYTGRSSMYGHPMSTYTLAVDSEAGVRAHGIAMPTRVPKWMIYHLWFDKRRMVRKLTLHLKGLRIDAEISDWGKPVHIVPPRPRQLVGADGLSTSGAA